MKIRQKPEDFIVEELNDFKIVTSGNSLLYILEKESIDLLTVLDELSALNAVPLSDISFAGIKDRHGITSQYISVPIEYPLEDLSADKYSIKLLGEIAAPIKRGDLLGNRFTLTIRNLTMQDVDSAKAKAKVVSKIGIPNYFDSQRFGSYIENQFIIKDVLAKDFSSALKLYLTHHVSDDVPELTMYKKILKKKWSNLSDFEARNTHGRVVIREYQKTNSWEKAYQKLPALERELFVSAYQSFVWNECVKILLKQNVERKKLFGVHYKAGMLTFFNNLDQGDIKRIPFKFPTVSHIPPEGKLANKLQSRILSKDKLIFSNLDIENMTGNYFKSHLRQLIVIPQSLELGEAEKDDFICKGNKNPYKLKVSFELPKGSYATIVLKALFEN